MINSGDIINYQSDIWLSQEFILENTGVSYNYLRVAKVRAKKDDNKSWQHTELMNRTYFSYSALPRTATNQLPPLNLLISQASELHDDVTSIVTAATYNRYRMFSSSVPNNEAAKAAAVIHEASIYCRQNGISFSKSPFFERLGHEIDVQGLKYLPKTWRNLRDKVRDYADGTDIKELVTVKNEGNNNRAAFANNELIKGWIIEMANSQRNYSYAFMWRKIRTICTQYSIDKIPSQRWVSDFVSRPETQFLIQERYGANTRFNHKFRSYTPTQSALFAGDCWDIDGTRVNIIDHAGHWIDRSGKKRSGQKFLYIIAVRDVMSGHVLGWEYCYEESAQAVINALAMAVKTSGYFPYELRYDRFPGHNTSDWQWVETGLQAAGVRMTQTVKAEGKASIERWWGTLQSVFMMDSDYYYGEGVKSTRRYAHRAKEYVAGLRKQAMKRGFNFNDAAREADSILEAYTNRPYSEYSTKFRKIDKSPLELHEQSDKPNTTVCEDAHFCYLFGLRKQVSIRNNMIVTQIENVPYYYAIDDVELIEKYTGVKLLNCFDFEDLDTVHLFDGTDYLGTFDRLTPAQQFGPDKDMRAVGKTKAIAEKVKSHRYNKLNSIDAQKEEALQSVEPEEVDITGEIGVLQTGLMKKHAAEAAETAFLHEQWNDDDEELDIDVRKQY